MVLSLREERTVILVTDTAYLYQYFLEHSSTKNDTSHNGVKKVERPEKEQEVKRDGKHTRQHD
jgi:hypothetical protein